MRLTLRTAFRTGLRTGLRFGVILPAAALPALAGAQNYSDLPPLAPLGEAEVRTLPPEYRNAPVAVVTDENVTNVDGVETITRTRRIEGPRHHPAPAPVHPVQHAQSYVPQYAPVAYPAPAVFERDQWIAECERRTAGQGDENTGKIIGGLLGAIAGGVAGYEIAGVGDRVLGTVLGVGGGGLIGGLLGSLFDGVDDDERYDCETALDSYLSQYGGAGGHVASRQIAYPAYAHGYPANYSYGYSYAPPPQVVLVPVRTEVQQQVVVRETERYETYTVPGTRRIVPAPSPKLIKTRRR